jgi:ribosomal protein S10
MPFVTTMRLESGDRRRLESVVEGIKEDAARKGVELKGPHPEPPAELRVAQSKTLGPGNARFPPWNYTVYARRVEIVGHEDFAREVASRTYPPGIHVAVDVDQRRQVGGR